MQKRGFDVRIADTVAGGRALLAVVTREGEALPDDSPWPGVHVPVTRVDVSSTGVRRRVAEGRTIRYLVPEAVRAVIERERLYRDHSR